MYLKLDHGQILLIKLYLVGHLLKKLNVVLLNLEYSIRSIKKWMYRLFWKIMSLIFIRIFMPTIIRSTEEGHGVNLLELNLLKNGHVGMDVYMHKNLMVHGRKIQIVQQQI